MAQLGVGVGSSYPNAIDVRQVFRNGSSPQPDSDTRLDAEAINDSLAAIVAIETALGAGVNGKYGSLAARLNQALPGAGSVPGIVTFTNALAVTIPGTQHNVGQAALLWQLYDNQIPAHAVEPGAVQFQVSPSTYNVSLQFPFAFTGALALGAQSPIYLANFVNTDTVSVPGTVHQLPSADLLFQCYYYSDPTDLWNAIEPGSLTVDPITRDVLMKFGTGINLTGTLVLSAGGPVYATTFTAMDHLIIPGSVHLLGTPAILFQCYDDASPRNALADPDVSVNPSTFDIEVRFTVPMSGRIVFAATSTFTGNDFVFKDGGIVNQSAVQVRSNNGDLTLQAGSGNHIYLLDRTGVAGVVLDMTPTTFLALNAFGPRMLELSGQEFGIGDGGIPNTDQVRVFSSAHALALQTGPTNLVYVLNATGTAIFTLNLATGELASPGTIQLKGTNFQLRDGGVAGSTACGVGTASGALYLQSGTANRIYIADQGANLTCAFMPANGALGLGTLTPTAQLELTSTGAIKAGGGPWLAPSGLDLKQDIAPFTDGLDVLLAFEPISFQYNGLGGIPATGERYIGLVAEQVEPVAPYMVRMVERALHPDEAPTPQPLLDAAALPYLLVNTVKTLHAELQAARQAQSRLEQQVALLAARVMALDHAEEETAP